MTTGDYGTERPDCAAIPAIKNRIAPLAERYWMSSRKLAIRRRPAGGSVSAGQPARNESRMSQRVSPELLRSRPGSVSPADPIVEGRT